MASLGPNQKLEKREKCEPANPHSNRNTTNPNIKYPKNTWIERHRSPSLVSQAMAKLEASVQWNKRVGKSQIRVRCMGGSLSEVSGKRRVRVYFGMVRSSKSPLAAPLWQATQLDLLLTEARANTAALISPCLTRNHSLSVVRKGAALEDQRFDGLATKKALISAVSAGDREASVPKCLSRPLMIFFQEAAGSKPGG